MPPKQGAKRKSESPTNTEGNLVERKQHYSTRSSNRKRVSYNESNSEGTEEELYEPPQKIVCSSSDDDFVSDGDLAEANNDQIGRNSAFTASQNKKNSKDSSASTKDTFKKQKGRISSQIPINLAFKPVCVDSSKLKSELNLSDSDDSEHSSNEDCNSEPRKIDTGILSLTGNSHKIEECKDNTPQKKEKMEESLSVDINPWMKNLEALKNDYVIEEKPAEAVNSTAKATPKKKGKQLKQLKNKSSKIAEGKESNEISVAEMLKLEDAQNDSCSEEDDENWERVKPAKSPVEQQERELPHSVEVTVDVSGLKRKKKGMDVENMIRLKINRIRREIQLDLHQVSLVGLLAHGYLVNKMLSDPAVMGTALSIVPSSGFPPTRTDLNYLEKLVKWFKNHFKVTATKASDSTYPEKQNILDCISSGKATSVEELVYTCVALCRSLGILSRLVLSLQPLSAKVDSSELRPKTPPGQKKIKDATLSDKSEKGASEKSQETKNQKTKRSSKQPAEPPKKSANSSHSTTKVRSAPEKDVSKAKPLSKSTKSRTQNLRENCESQPTSSKTKDSKSPVKNVEKSNSEPRRSRRKSAEKPVKYEESPLEDTEEEAIKASKKKTSPKEKTIKPIEQKEFKKPKSKKKRNQESSSEDFEESAMSDLSEIEETCKSSVSKKESPAQQRSRKIISSDSENETAKKKKKTDVWLEVYLEQEEQWMSVDIVSGQIHCDRHLERNASDPLLYVVAYNFDLTWKDVTARYASSFLSVTRKQRVHPLWSRIMNIHREKQTPRSKAEDESLEKSLTERPMPTSISEFKSHPLYALQRHLLKFEAIYPATAIPVGFIRKEPIYARECVKNLHSRETWLKEAKVVRIGEKPYKIVKARPKWDRYSQKVITDQPLELFGDWQIEDYIPPPAVDGVVPRNAYGNVELFLPSMLPKGTKHLQIPGLNKVARRLGIDCAPAMTGWDYHGGWSHPVYDGFVVCEEHVETLMDAWQAANEEQEKREREKKEKRVYDNWRRLIRGLLIRERLQAKYFRNLTEDETPSSADNVIVTEAHPVNVSSNATKKPVSTQRKKKK